MEVLSVVSTLTFLYMVLTAADEIDGINYYSYELKDDDGADDGDEGNENIDVEDQQDRLFDQWIVDKDGNCNILAYKKPHENVDQIITLLKLINETTIRPNSKMQSVSVEVFNKEDFNNSYSLETVRSTSWRYKACKSACKEVITHICETYNCHGMKEYFKKKSNNYCQEQFDSKH